ncbi:MAG TPA: SIMPL domain-containing protein, partial [Longilinea sp.]|nr:SIMPL domain-containing protein [Longilinea sp.]
INIGVQNTAPTVTDALKQNTAQAQAIRAALTALNVDDKDIQTSNFSVNPQQQYGPDGTLQSTDYSANNTVTVTVRNLSNLGQILDAVVNSGANTINSISFDLLNKDDAYAQARQSAVDDARSQAEALAKAAGVQLGDVQTINVYSINPVVPAYEGKGGTMMSIANSSVPIATGQMVISVQVNIVWALK